MNKNNLKIKGAWIPSFFIWILGLIHGKILKTAALDSDGQITSSYVTGKLKLFRELAAQRMRDLEQELKAVRVEASRLMAEEADLHHNHQIPDVSDASSIQARRNNRRRNIQKASLLACRKEILARLTEIDGKINDCELLARDDLDAAAALLQRRLSTYAHGVLLRPVHLDLIPPFEYEESFDSYYQAHQQESRQLRNLLKEVYYLE